ncbi:MAG: class II fructose-bisphosphatase [Myxococcota bacterium]
MERNLALDAARVTEAAALASARMMGLGDAHQADDVAVQAMRRAFRSLDICGTIVVGEGHYEESPRLYYGEKVGRWAAGDPEVRLALDALEGARLCAQGRPDAMSVIAMARNGSFMPAPDTYMDKIVVGPTGMGAIDITRSVSHNLQSVADAKGVYVEDITVAILDRPRHEQTMREIREAGARIRMIVGGDLSAALATCREETGIDMVIGVGGAPEGVLAAAALRCVGGEIQCRLRPRNDEEREMIRTSGLDAEEVYTTDQLASGHVLFAATGITDGHFLEGVRFLSGGARTNSVVMRSKTMTVRYIEAHHHFDRKPDYGDF